jgi:CDP-glucose 4,6-dehydratase
LNGEPFNFGPAAHVNETVGELIDAMSARWAGTYWEVPAGAEQHGHEATLLKLSCDKALAYLDWRAAMEFPQTVAFTVDWYRRWFGGDLDLYRFTVSQIEEYCAVASDRGLAWTGA